MSDENPDDQPNREQSIRQWRLYLARARHAETRNPVRCHCQHDAHPPEWHSKRRKAKRILNTQHAALHFSKCPHSSLTTTTKPKSKRPVRERAIPVIIIR